LLPKFVGATEYNKMGIQICKLEVIIFANCLIIRAFFDCKFIKQEKAKVIDQNEAIVDRLKELKVKTGMTAQQIAEKSNLPESTVTRILSGKTANPTIATVISIWKAMGGKATDLFDDTVKVDVVSEAPQVVVPQIDERLYTEIMNIYKDLLKVKDKRISILMGLVALLICALVAVVLL
jgi:transcriptional regulator with XRE-family HTH domain